MLRRLVLHTGDDLPERANLAEEARSHTEEHPREQMIGAGNSLRVGAAEKAGLQRNDRGNGAEVAAVLAHGAQHTLQLPGQAVEQAHDDRGLLRGRRQPALPAQGEDIAERNARDDVGGFELGVDGLEEAVLFLRQPGEPVLAHVRRALHSPRAASVSHDPTCQLVIVSCGVILS